MLLSLHKYLLYEIFYFLSNEEIMIICCTNKVINNIVSNYYFKKSLNYRKHPIVFNRLGNLCRFCNISVFILTDLEIKFIYCRHI